MNTPRRIVILGGGTAGWIAATLIAHAWGSTDPGKGVAITVVESPDIATIGVGEGSTPSLKRFFEIVGVTERDWMPACHATYKVGIRFAGWSPAAPWPDYRHPFATQIDTLTEPAFLLNCRNRRLGHDVPVRPDDFLLNGVLAAQGKTPLTPPYFPFRMEYGYHFDAGLLRHFLRDLATGRGVVHRPARVVAANRAENGDLAALVTDDGEEIAADFFIDCSGFAGLLIGQALGVPFDSFAANLFNDAAVVMPIAMDRPPPVETLATALSSGWCWSIPLHHRFGNGYVYARDFITADAAEAELRAHLGVDDTVPARHLRFDVGQRTSHWDRNCLAVGLSQGFVEPLEATALHVVLTTVDLFIKAYVQPGTPDHRRDTVNAAITTRIDGIRDYIVAHYTLTTRTDTTYWRANAANTVLSDPLRHRLDIWFRKGDLTEELRRHLTHFPTLSWHCLLAGYGLFPAADAAARNDVDFYTSGAISDFLAGCSLNFAVQA